MHQCNQPKPYIAGITKMSRRFSRCCHADVQERLTTLTADRGNIKCSTAPSSSPANRPQPATTQGSSAGALSRGTANQGSPVSRCASSSQPAGRRYHPAPAPAGRSAAAPSRPAKRSQKPALRKPRLARHPRDPATGMSIRPALRAALRYSSARRGNQPRSWTSLRRG